MMTDPLQPPYLTNQPTLMMPMGQAAGVDRPTPTPQKPAVKPVKADRFEATSVATPRQTTEAAEDDPQKPKKSMIPMVLFSVVALTAAGFGIWAVTHKEEAGKLLDNAKEGVNKLFKKEEKKTPPVNPPDNTGNADAGVNPPVPPDAGNTGGNPPVPPVPPVNPPPANPNTGDNTPKGWGETLTEWCRNRPTKTSKTTTTTTTPTAQRSKKIKIYRESNLSLGQLIKGDQDTLSFFEKIHLDAILSKPANKMTLDDLQYIIEPSASQRTFNLPDDQAFLFATHILESLSDSTSAISEHSKEVILNPKANRYTLLQTLEILMEIYKKKRDNLTQGSEEYKVVNKPSIFTWYLSDILKDEKTLGKNTSLDTDSIKIISDFHKASRSNNADQISIQFASVFNHLKEMNEAVLKLIEEAKANATPATTTTTITTP
jgi:hypothetical protein